MNKLILTEQSNPESKNIDLMTGEQIAELINREDMKVALAVNSQTKQIGQAIELIANAFKNGGRLAYFGAGTSGRIGILDASECPPTYGVEANLVQGFIAGGEEAITHAVENAEDNANYAQRDLAAFSPTLNDVVVAISASGNPEYTFEILRLAKNEGAKTIAISTNPEARFKQFADIFICPIVGPEVITGSSRMKSGTAQKLILNMLTTGAMVRIGKTYHNYMIDLKISNKKLLNRATRIVSEICNIPLNEAEKYLEKSGYKVKLACVMAINNCTRQEASLVLKKNDDLLRAVIGDIK